MNLFVFAVNSLFLREHVVQKRSSGNYVFITVCQLEVARTRYTVFSALMM